MLKKEVHIQRVKFEIVFFQDIIYGFNDDKNNETLNAYSLT